MKLSVSERSYNRMKARSFIDRVNKKNCLQWSLGETWDHVVAKLLICQSLKRQGHHFYTECVFLEGGRADVFDADALVVYEILESEKEENIAKKAKVYPVRIVALRAKDVLAEKETFI